MVKKLILTALTCIVFLSSQGVYGMERNQDDEQKPWNYSMLISRKNGEVIQKQFANNPVWLHGFDIIHKAGMRGENTVVAFLEEGVNPKHLQFRPNQVKLIDCSQYAEIIGEDKAQYRHNRDLDFNRLAVRRLVRPLTINEHGNHVMGVSLSQPAIYTHRPFRDILQLLNPETGDTDLGWPLSIEGFYDMNHPGGCIPNADAILYSYSHFYHKKAKILNTSSLSIYPIDLFENLGLLRLCISNKEGKEVLLSEYYSTLHPPLSEKEKTFKREQPIDDSPIVALKAALQGPAFAINWSTTPLFLMDSQNAYKAPDKLLNEIGELAEKNDKIIVFCSNNYSQCLENRMEVAFYKQILDHPILSKRVIFSVNLCPTIPEDEKKIGQLFIKGHVISFKLYDSSNWPGDSFKSLCLSAVGSSIISGNDVYEFKRDSGTSEAAPVITSLATLVKQKFPEKNGREVVQHLKDKALPLGDPKYTGCGYVYAPLALEIPDIN